jgi:hypothetical protein
MLFRFTGDSAIAISQPAHAWVSGQLARAWIRERFEPWEEVCLAAEQHDIGWLTWEAQPTLNPNTGLPYSFREMPRETHIDLWSQASRLALAYGRYPALLVSLHGTGLYERFGPGPDASPQIREAIDQLLEREYAWQQELAERLRSDERYRFHSTPEAIERNRGLISLWDAMSLVLCGGIKESQTISGEFTFTAQQRSTSQTNEIVDHISVDPWPFEGTELNLIVEGRRLDNRYNDDDGLREALTNAPWVALSIQLVRC